MAQTQKTIKNTINNFNYLNNMPCNTLVHLQIITPTKTYRIKSKLIGIDPNMSVILSMRQEDDWSAVKQYMREGQKAIVRLINPNIAEASILAFRTKIQKIMSIAGNWLVMDYPKELEKVSLRKYARIPINIECDILDLTSNELIVSGILNDISANGCAFLGPRVNQQNTPQPSCKIDHDYQLKITASENEAPLMTTIEIKSSSSADQLQYGLAFKKEDQDSTAFIQKVIALQLSQEPSSKSKLEVN